MKIRQNLEKVNTLIQICSILMYAHNKNLCVFNFKRIIKILCIIRNAVYEIMENSPKFGKVSMFLCFYGVETRNHN